jgi:acetyl esterase/lipase
MMKASRAFVTFALGLALAGLAPAGAQSGSDPRISDDGTVTLDGVRIPLSDKLSDEGRAYMRHLIINKPFGVSVSDLAKERARQDEIMFGFLRPMRERYKVEISEQKIAGIVADVVVPAEGIPPENRGRVLINVHGGGFVTGARSTSLVESVPLAALMKIKVVSIDYRMAPEHQFPAASEDVEAAYRELLKTYDPSQIGIYGCSAGGFLTAQATARLAAHDLPMPAAIGVFCAGLNGYFGGDSTSLGGALLGMLPPPAGSARPPASAPATASPNYLSTARADDPLAYPIVSPDLLAKFPPTLFVTGSRGFDFSSALDSHNKLAATGVESRFHGWDGMFHGFFYNSELPESREAYDVMVNFFDSHLAK